MKALDIWSYVAPVLIRKRKSSTASSVGTTSSWPSSWNCRCVRVRKVQTSSQIRKLTLLEQENSLHKNFHSQNIKQISTVKILDSEVLALQLFYLERIWSEPQLGSWQTQPQVMILHQVDLRSAAWCWPSTENLQQKIRKVTFNWTIAYFPSGFLNLSDDRRLIWLEETRDKDSALSGSQHVHDKQ